MNDLLIIIGAGGHGKVAADIALKLGKWKEIVFSDDDLSKKSPFGLKSIGNISGALKKAKDADFFVALGNNATREKITKMLYENKATVISLIHPLAVTGKDANIGGGTVIMAGAVINTCTTIGQGCIINTSCSIDHDSTIGDFVHISPGANLGGTVNVGKGSWIGIGSTVINNVDICNDCVIGAGSVVLKNIDSPGTYAGLPAVKIK